MNKWQRQLLMPPLSSKLSVQVLQKKPLEARKKAHKPSFKELIPRLRPKCTDLTEAAQLKNLYRIRGHRIAFVDFLGGLHDSLDPRHFG